MTTKDENKSLLTKLCGLIGKKEGGKGKNFDPASFDETIQIVSLLAKKLSMDIGELKNIIAEKMMDAVEAAINSGKLEDDLRLV
jgi:hypothetical protein